MEKKCNVVMLPINEKSIMCLSQNKLFWFHGIEPDVEKLKYQHLYITSDEQITKDFKGFAIVTVKDDNRIHYLVEVIVTEQNQCYCKGDRKFSFEYYSVKPIISTTNNDMSIFDLLLPQPSQQFIEKYIEEFNKGNTITEVDVEYEKNKLYPMIQNNNIRLKINPDNTINIKPTKDSWNREEVVNLLYKSRFHKNSSEEKFDKWIEENL